MPSRLTSTSFIHNHFRESHSHLRYEHRAPHQTPDIILFRVNISKSRGDRLRHHKKKSFRPKDIHFIVFMPTFLSDDWTSPNIFFFCSFLRFISSERHLRAASDIFFFITLLEKYFIKSFGSGWLGLARVGFGCVY